LILGVAGILRSRDPLGHDRRPHEQHGEQRGPGDRPLQERSRSHRAEPEHQPPLRDLEEVVRMAGVSEQSLAQEALGCGSVRRALPFALVELPLLLVGDGLSRQRADEEHGEGSIERSERRLVLQGGPSGQRDQHQQRALVDHDEEQVEELELPSAHRLPQNAPAVVLHACVATFAGQVEGEPSSPHGCQHPHHVQPGIAEASSTREDPEIDRRRDRPDPVDLGGVMGDQGDDPAASRDDPGEYNDDQQWSHAAMLCRNGCRTRSKRCSLRDRSRPSLVRPAFVRSRWCPLRQLTCRLGIAGLGRTGARGRRGSARSAADRRRRSRRPAPDAR
jgi:hypothetical protein